MKQLVDQVPYMLLYPLEALLSRVLAIAAATDDAPFVAPT